MGIFMTLGRRYHKFQWTIKISNQASVFAMATTTMTIFGKNAPFPLFWLGNITIIWDSAIFSKCKIFRQAHTLQ